LRWLWAKLVAAALKSNDSAKRKVLEIMTKLSITCMVSLKTDWHQFCQNPPEAKGRRLYEAALLIGVILAPRHRHKKEPG